MRIASAFGGTPGVHNPKTRLTVIKNLEDGKYRGNIALISKIRLIYNTELAPIPAYAPVAFVLQRLLLDLAIEGHPDCLRILAEKLFNGACSFNKDIQLAKYCVRKAYEAIQSHPKTYGRYQKRFTAFLEQHKELRPSDSSEVNLNTKDLLVEYRVNHKLTSYDGLDKQVTQSDASPYLPYRGDLQRAVIEGDAIAVNQLILQLLLQQSPKELTKVDDLGNTPLHVAVIMMVDEIRPKFNHMLLTTGVRHINFKLISKYRSIAILLAKANPKVIEMKNFKGHYPIDIITTYNKSTVDKIVTSDKYPVLFKTLKPSDNSPKPKRISGGCSHS